MADQPEEKARRRAARAVVGEYHERKLCRFCNLSSPEGAAWAIADARERGEDLDWWTPRRRR
jgi:hypothetical protein